MCVGVHVGCYSTRVMLAVLSARCSRLLARVNCHVLLVKLVVVVEHPEIILRLRVHLMAVLRRDHQTTQFMRARFLEAFGHVT